MPKRYRSLLVVIGAIVSLILVGVISLNFYLYSNPLEEHSVSFQEYVPSSLPAGVKIAHTDSVAIVLDRDPRNVRHEWFGRDIQQAKLQVTLQDSSGNYGASITESSGPSNCIVHANGYRLTTQGQPYCLMSDNKSDVNTVAITTSRGNTVIGAHITIPAGSSLSRKDLASFVDSFQKVHLLNVPVKDTNDPMNY